MSHRTVGRHRRRRSSPVSATAVAGTALSASLIAGVAIGTAAASASDHRRVPPATAAARPDLPSDGDLVAGRVQPAGLVAGRAQSAGLVAGGAQPAGLVAGALSGKAVRRKQKPRPVVRAESVTAAWVNPNPTAVVTSCFGQRWGRLHAGVDLAAADGTPIVAAGAGVVVRAGVAEGYGNAVLIDHGNGYLTHYGHLSKITVNVGQHVAAGEQIGTEGSTGHSTGPHLHFEVHEGFYQNPIEPTEWMHRHGVDIPGCVAL